MREFIDLRYIDRPVGSFVDRKITEPKLGPIDVIMATLDSEFVLEKCLYTVYREIPVRKLFVCDGGSKDETLEILKKFPRVEIFVKPEIRTGGKLVGFLMSLTETEWFAFVDSDIELSEGWYDEMNKDKKYDVIESSNRISAYHLFRQDELKLEEGSRASDFCHLVKKDAIQNYHCEDDYMLRYTDLLFQQAVEKSGYKYGKVKTKHVHHETERIAYQSDNEKNFRKMEWNEPEWKIIDKEKADAQTLKNAKAIVKYLDPDFHVVKNSKWLDGVIRKLDRKWVLENGPQWIKRYDHGSSKTFSLKKFVYKNFLEKKNKGKS